MTVELGQIATMAPVQKASIRRVDHLVLPTAELTLARRRLSDLGFTVAPDAQHPFGTRNACVFFADGTYLEPLMVGERDKYEEAAKQGNVFVQRDLAYRFRRGDEGISALVMASDDAENDHRQFGDAGISAGDNLTFSRNYQKPDGGTAEASFELAFAADLRAPDVFFFTCQRLQALNVDRTRLETHANGVIGIRQIVMSETNPSDFQYLMQEIVQQREVNAHSFGLEIMSSNADIAVLNAAGLKGFFGLEGGTHARGLRLRVIVVATSSLQSLPDLLADAEIAFERIGERIVVPAAPGQGAAIAFDAA